MTVDLSDLFKYAWVLLLTILPKYITSFNQKFKKLEDSDEETLKKFAGLHEDVVVMNTKLDYQIDTIQEIGKQVGKLVESVTELKVEQGRMKK
jgi:uncharacterized protein YoxC